VARIKAWTRARFSLDEDVAVAVAEIACGLPGCPPLETVVTFWTAPDRRHAYKVFKRTVDVAEDDLPPAFMKNALIADENELLCC
jgi:nitrate reductase delta subunit